MRAQRYTFQTAAVHVLLYTWYVPEKTYSVLVLCIIEYEKAGGRLFFQSSRSESMNFANVTALMSLPWGLSAVARSAHRRPIIGKS